MYKILRIPSCLRVVSLKTCLPPPAQKLEIFDRTHSIISFVLMSSIVGIVYANNYRRVCCNSPKFGDRFAMIMDLINAYKMVTELYRIPPLEWNSFEESYKDLTTFHSIEYIEAVKRLQTLFEDGEDNELTPEEETYFDSFGLNYDCPGFRSVFDYALATVQGSLAAADSLIHRQCKVAINWAGGWHHAKRSEASGFCYLNDIVLAIHRLLSNSSIHFPNLVPPEANRVLYLDFDLHHGDGVEEAFWYSSRVVTFSVHHASPGFFPGTGTWTEGGNNEEHLEFQTGSGRGRFSAFNLPLDEGTDDAHWISAVCPILDLLYTIVQPTYVVVQCGADCLSTDPHRIFHLTNADSSQANSDRNSNVATSGYLCAIKKVLSWKRSVLILGGGGYNFADTARLWARITATIISEVKEKEFLLASDIPEHSFLDRYGPDYELDISTIPYVYKNLNDTIRKHHIRILKQICDYANLNKISYDYENLKTIVYCT